MTTAAWYVVLVGVILSITGAGMTATLARIPLGVIVGALRVVLGMMGGLLWYSATASWSVFSMAPIGLSAVSAIGVVLHWWRRKKMTREQRQEMELIARIAPGIK